MPLVSVKLQILCALTLSCHLYFFLSIIRKGLTVKSVKPTFIDQLERITQIPTLAKVREKGNYLTKYRVILMGLFLSRISA